MKLAIVGSRSYNNFNDLTNEIYNIEINGFPLDEIISGGAKGTDSMAKCYALERNIPIIEFLAEWDKYGKSAGYKRNVHIVDACDKLIAFWDGQSKGTKHSIDLAEKAGKLLKVISI